VTGLERKSAPGELGSLASARTFIETVHHNIRSFDADELLDALHQLDHAFREFPELLIDPARERLLDALRSAADQLPDVAAIPVTAYCVASDPSDSTSLAVLLGKIAEAQGGAAALPPILRSLCRSREIEWSAIRPILDALDRKGARDAALAIISEVIDCLRFPDENGAAQLRALLSALLADGEQQRLDGRVSAGAARAARLRLRGDCFGCERRSSADLDALLATTERLSVSRPPARSNSAAEFRWPSGRLSFDAFLQQWPCEIELAAEPDNTAFVKEAYQAILLRAPNAAEADQFLRLLQKGAVSRSWVIEDLLASQELSSLERRLRVICEGRVITPPACAGEAEMPTVTWPSKRTGDD
jgi:hypothetical protein